MSMIAHGCATLATCVQRSFNQKLDIIAFERVRTHERRTFSGPGRMGDVLRAWQESGWGWCVPLEVASYSQAMMSRPMLAGGRVDIGSARPGAVDGAGLA